VFRLFLSRLLRADPMIEVIGEAGSAADAEQLIASRRPDVITLDLEMPGKSGLEFLRDTAAPQQIPTIVISGTTPRGARRSIEALELGAVDVIAKPRGALPGTADHMALDAIATRVRSVAAVKIVARDQTTQPCRVPDDPVALPQPSAFAREDWIITLGASTGGVQALTTVLQAMPLDCPPILIVQHMPEGFTAAFSQRLDTLCRISIREACAGDVPRAGQALIAPGGAQHLALVRDADDRTRVDLVEGDPVCFSRPAVDVLFFSAARTHGSRVSAAVMTGMGSDGALGLLALRRAGAQTFAQDEETSLIYGMPARAWETGGALAQVPLHDMTRRLLASVGTSFASRNLTGSIPPPDRLSMPTKEL
jgi:two-component system, chemotaxis family, protein-glutamate methylesterase/glutaminase